MCRRSIGVGRCDVCPRLKSLAVPSWGATRHELVGLAVRSRGHSSSFFQGGSAPTRAPADDPLHPHTRARRRIPCCETDVPGYAEADQAGVMTALKRGSSRTCACCRQRYARSTQFSRFSLALPRLTPLMAKTSCTCLRMGSAASPRCSTFGAVCDLSRGIGRSRPDAISPGMALASTHWFGRSCAIILFRRSFGRDGGHGPASPSPSVTIRLFPMGWGAVLFALDSQNRKPTAASDTWPISPPSPLGGSNFRPSCRRCHAAERRHPPFTMGSARLVVVVPASATHGCLWTCGPSPRSYFPLLSGC